jgi:hypothetical protein
VPSPGVIEEMKRYETGYRGKPGAWEQATKERSDLRTSRLKPPLALLGGLCSTTAAPGQLLHLGWPHARGRAGLAAVGKILF